MRKISFIFFTLIAFSSLAQKIDREKLGYINYTQNPVSAELLDFQYYELSFNTADNDAFRRKIFEQNFEISPQLTADGSEAIDFRIEVLEGLFTYTTPKAGNYTDKERKMYYYSSEMKYHYTLKVFVKEKEIFRDDLRGSVKLQGQASESLTIANEYHVAKKEKVKQEIMPEVAEKVSLLYKNQYGFVTKTTFVNAIKIKEKKFEYPEFNKAFNNLERVCELVKASLSSQESVDKLQESISIFKNFVTDATPEIKKSKKDADVTAAAYYNLGMSYFLNSDYTPATIAFKQAMSYDDKVVYDVEFYIKLCENLSTRISIP